MGRISKQGDKYLRWFGTMSVIRHGRKTNFENNLWLADLVHRKPAKVAAEALANKNTGTARAVIGPMPGTLMKRRHSVLSRANANTRTGVGRGNPRRDISPHCPDELVI